MTDTVVLAVLIFWPEGSMGVVRRWLQTDPGLRVGLWYGNLTWRLCLWLWRLDYNLRVQEGRV